MGNILSCYKVTSDDWYPNFRGNLVKVEGGWNPPRELLGPATFYVSVWGEDDLGMTIEVSDAEQGLSIFNRVLLLEDVTKESLHELGFDYC